MTTVLGLDVGGSGMRAALARQGVGRVRTGRAAVPVRFGDAGLGVDALLGALLPLVDRVLAGERPRAVALGATGLVSFGGELRAALPAALAARVPGARVALAADAVTAHLGALDGASGVVVAGGTGLIALGGSVETGWRRADGWGHLLGDAGGGAWIGRAGLEAALRAYDGRRGGSARLLTAATERFGDPKALPAVVQTRGDRAALLGSFAPAVAVAAVAGDAAARDILVRAGRHVAEAAAAAAGQDHRVVAHTGGLFAAGPPLLDPFAAELRRLLPGASLRPGVGTPLDGALLLADLLADGAARPMPGLLWLAETP